MKKLLILFALMLVTFTANAQSYVYDVNFDGVINISDISCLVNKILGETNPGEDTDVSPLQLSTRKLDLAKSSSGVVEIISGSGSYNVHSCNEAVATASLSSTSITVTAIDEGKTFITVTDTESGHSATIKVVVEGEATPSYLTCPDENHPHIIDLGLPSGTKWACCNVGADKPEAYGGKYAWGETNEKTNCNWNTYIHCDGSEVTCHDLGFDIAGTQNDVAHVQWGGSWVMPSLEQMNELLDNCSSEWTTLNGINGYKFTATNGGSVFLPAAGHHLSIYHNNFVSKRGDYWSSTLYSSSNEPSFSSSAYELFLEDGVQCTTASRDVGFSVRPVYTSSLILSKSCVDIAVGERTTVEISLGSGSYTVNSSDDNVAKVSLSGTTITVTGIANGYSLVTVSDASSGSSRVLTVKVGQLKSYLSCPDDHHPHLIDLGLPSGTKWACCNIDTSHPEKQSPTSYGGYYSWGETEEKTEYSYSTYKFFEGYGKVYDEISGEEIDGPLFTDIGEDIAGTEYDVAHENWGGFWRMPNTEQIEELINNCSYTWDNIDGVEGGRFIGSNGGQIFLPAAGEKDYSIFNDGSHCHYWSSSKGLLYYIMTFEFDNYGDTPGYIGRDPSSGFSVRPVAK